MAGKLNHRYGLNTYITSIRLFVFCQIDNNAWKCAYVNHELLPDRRTPNRDHRRTEPERNRKHQISEKLHQKTQILRGRAQNIRGAFSWSFYYFIVQLSSTLFYARVSFITDDANCSGFLSHVCCSCAVSRFRSRSRLDCANQYSRKYTDNIWVDVFMIVFLQIY